jgi:biopolymer transport protein ExbB/TolQ
MSPTWELLDKIGIVVALITVFVEAAQWAWLWHINDEMEDIGDEVDDIHEDISRDE